MLLISGMEQAQWKPRGPLTALFDRAAGLITTPMGSLWRKLQR